MTDITEEHTPEKIEDMMRAYTPEGFSADLRALRVRATAGGASGEQRATDTVAVCFSEKKDHGAILGTFACTREQWYDLRSHVDALFAKMTQALQKDEIRPDDSESLPNELRRRANDAYAATGINLSVLHQVAYRLEFLERKTIEQEKVIAAMRELVTPK